MGGLRSVKTRRVNRSVIAETWDRATENRAAGMDWPEAVKHAAGDEALAIYRPKVAAMLRSAGFEVGDEDDLTLDVVLDAIKARTGLDINNLTREDVTRAINEQLSIYVSHELGFEVRNVLDTAGLKTQIDEHIKDCIRNNRPSKLVPQRLLTKIREAAAFAQMGYSPDEKRMILNRWYQKKYRRNNKLVWD